MKAQLAEMGRVRGMGTKPGAIAFALALGLVLEVGSGCKSPPPTTRDPEPYVEVRFREGDVIRIAFPGAPNLDTTQQVRRDGKITLAMGGEVTALGKTPSELEKELLKIYDAQLVVKQVVVTINASTYPVFITGAVLKPGKLEANRPLSVLEAVMEAGGVDYAKADLKNVRILRQIDGKIVGFHVNLRETLKGNRSEPFYLKPSDIVYVPEKFSWF
jgi:polysaccharide export outer membrane protein